MKPGMALFALCISACGGSPGEPSEEPEGPGPGPRNPIGVIGGEWGTRAPR